MGNRLSHSQINLYLQCGEAYRLSYRERLRTKEISSALIFGSAIGKALEYSLNPSCTDIPNLASTKDMFDYHWRHQEINGVLTNLENCPDIVYSKYDHDPELANDPYESLRAKAHLIIDAFETKLKPLITKVWSTEEKIELSNDEGDSSIGYADAVVSMIGYDVPIVIDFKTAARRYEPDSVITSVQLSQYLHVLGPKYGTRLAGYAVFLKNISKNRQKVCSVCSYDGSGSRHKTCSNDVYKTKVELPDGSRIGGAEMERCGGDWVEKIKPEAEMQLIIDTIPERFENFVIDNIATVNSAIKAEIYVKNVNSCKDNGYGRACQYYSYCHSGSLDGLVKVEAKPEEKK